MNYWLDLFTGTTWREFREAGADVSGFRASQVKTAKRMQPGDIFLCYLTGVMRWVGALEITGSSTDTRQIWKEQDFPVRFAVTPLVMLDPEHGVPMQELEGRVKFYASSKDRGKFQGFVRSSLNLFRERKDGELILSLLRAAERSPISRPVDPKKLARKPLFKVERVKGVGRPTTLVSVPEPEDIPAVTPQGQEPAEITTTRHSEIQHLLLTLGVELGLDVWVARNDRSRKWNGSTLGSIQKMLDRLPTQFNDNADHRID